MTPWVSSSKAVRFDQKVAEVSNQFQDDIRGDASVTSNMIQAFYQEAMEIKLDLNVARHLVKMIRVKKKARRSPEVTSD